MVACLALARKFFFTKSGVQCREMLAFFSIFSQVGLRRSLLYSGAPTRHGLLKKTWFMLMKMYLETEK